MCGRIFQTLPLHRLLQIARARKCNNEQMHTTSYNVCPTTYIPVVRSSKIYRQQPEDIVKKQQPQDQRQLQFMKWGHQGAHNFIINGRIEQLTAKRTFVNIIQNRCVIIMEGYYQWKDKEAFSFKSKVSDHFLVAGLYTSQNETIILTKDATPQLAKVHHRMPVILSPQQVQLWLDPKNTKDINAIIQKSLLKKEKQVWKNVGFAKLAPHVNSLKQKSVKCLMTIEQYKKQLDKTGLMKYWKKPTKVQIIGNNGEVIEDKTKQQKIDLAQRASVQKKNPLISEMKQQQQAVEQSIAKQQVIDNK